VDENANPNDEELKGRRAVDGGIVTLLFLDLPLPPPWLFS